MGWTASAKWGEAPALDGQTAMPLCVRLSDGLGSAALLLALNGTNGQQFGAMCADNALGPEVCSRFPLPLPVPNEGTFAGMAADPLQEKRRSCSEPQAAPRSASVPFDLPPVLTEKLTGPADLAAEFKPLFSEGCDHTDATSWLLKLTAKPHFIAGWTTAANCAA